MARWLKKFPMRDCPFCYEQHEGDCGTGKLIRRLVSSWRYEQPHHFRAAYPAAQKEYGTDDGSDRFEAVLFRHCMEGWLGNKYIRFDPAMSNESLLGEYNRNKRNAPRVEDPYVSAISEQVQAAIKAGILKEVKDDAK